MGTAVPAALDAERLRQVDSYVEEHRHLRQGNKVLHGYPPPLLWRDRQVPLAEVLTLRSRTAASVPKRLITYVATPYCLPTRPERCGFCLFPSEVYRESAQLDEYLAALDVEGRLYAGHFDGAQLEGLYFGGGTANLYRPAQYGRLMEIVRGALGPLPPSAEVTLEGIPQLFSREKLEAMRESGINRISVGAQQLGDDLIRLSGRRQTAEQVLRTVEWCHELGLPCSVDLIFGWPRQTSDTMLADLRALAAAGVGHITHYELNLAGRSAFALERREELPSRDQNLELYREACRFLESAGYHQRTAYDWERATTAGSDAYRFEEAWHRPLRSAADGRLGGVDMWGWGFAGVTCFPGSAEEPGWTFLNHTRVADYLESLAKGRFPVQRGHRFSRRELRLNVLFQMLHALSVDLAEYQRLFGLDLLAEQAEVWTVLQRRGWARVRDGRIELVGDGVFHTPLVQTLLARAAGD